MSLSIKPYRMQYHMKQDMHTSMQNWARLQTEAQTVDAWRVEIGKHTHIDAKPREDDTHLIACRIEDSKQRG